MTAADSLHAVTVAAAAAERIHAAEFFESLAGPEGDIAEPVRTEHATPRADLHDRAPGPPVGLPSQ